MTMYKHLVQTIAVVMIVMGLALIVRTIPHFGVGILLGLLFVGAGVGRLLMLRRKAG